DRRAPQKLGQKGVLDHVLGHEVVGTDDADATLCRLAGEATADDNVRLDVHYVGLELVENAGRVRLASPRENEAQPVVGQPAPRVDAVDGELLALVLFCE